MAEELNDLYISVLILKRTYTYYFTEQNLKDTSNIAPEKVKTDQETTIASSPEWAPLIFA